jgi:hypothetical protein
MELARLGGGWSCADVPYVLPYWSNDTPIVNSWASPKRKMIARR